jgi:RND family efflux transporter MFP subunit
MSLRTALIMSALLLGSLTALAADRDAQKLNTQTTSPTEVPMKAPSAFLQGIAKAKLDALLRPAEQGTVTAVHVQEGEWVTAGTPLVTIDDSAARAAMVVAKASAEAHAAADQAELVMKQARTIVSRTRIAMHANAASEFELLAKENQLDQATANYELQLEQQQQAQAQLALAEEQLKRRTLTAPFDGRVIQIHSGLGNTIDPTQAAVHVAKLNELEVEMHLPVSLFNTIKAGETRELRAAAPVNSVLKARVVYVAPVVEPTSATFRVVFTIDNDALALPSGFEVWYQQD